jgi:hypothetical protein
MTGRSWRATKRAPAVSKPTKTDLSRIARLAGLDEPDAAIEREIHSVH